MNRRLEGDELRRVLQSVAPTAHLRRYRRRASELKRRNRPHRRTRPGEFQVRKFAQAERHGRLSDADRERVRAVKLPSVCSALNRLNRKIPKGKLRPGTVIRNPKVEADLFAQRELLRTRRAEWAARTLAAREKSRSLNKPKKGGKKA